jgi:hypothetical protein
MTKDDSILPAISAANAHFAIVAQRLARRLRDGLTCRITLQVLRKH